jgi:hypothetical protein
MGPGQTLGAPHRAGSLGEAFALDGAHIAPAWGERGSITAHMPRIETAMPRRSRATGASHFRAPLAPRLSDGAVGRPSPSKAIISYVPNGPTTKRLVRTSGTAGDAPPGDTPRRWVFEGSTGRLPIACQRRGNYPRKDGSRPACMPRIGELTMPPAVELPGRLARPESGMCVNRTTACECVGCWRCGARLKA